MSENNGILRIIISSLIGAGISLVLSLLLLLGVSALMLNSEQSESGAKLAVCATIFLSGAVGGLVAEKRGRGGAAFCGALAGALYFLLLCLGGLLLYGGIDMTNGGGLVALAAVFGSIAGALLGTCRKHRKKHK